MKSILNIMKLDLITMRAKKFSLGKFYVIVSIIAAVIGVIFPPLILGFEFALSLTAVTSFIDIDDKNGGEMTFAVIPVTRKQNVIARYGLITLILTVNLTLSLIVLKTAQLLDISGFFRATGELNESLSGVLGLKMNDFGFFALGICAMFAYGMIFSAMQLSAYFKSGRNSAKKSTARRLFILGLVYVVFAAVIMIEASSLDVKVLHSALAVLVSLFISLSASYNGALLAIVVLACAYGFVFYKAACSVIDYESREL